MAMYEKLLDLVELIVDLGFDQVKVICGRGFLQGLKLSC